jgi:hypothetical protein
MLSNYECMFRKTGVTEANSAFNMWSDDRYLPPHQRSQTFLNWMPSNETQDDGEAEDIQESTPHGPSKPSFSRVLRLIFNSKDVHLLFTC